MTMKPNAGVYRRSATLRRKRLDPCQDRSSAFTSNIRMTRRLAWLPRTDKRNSSGMQREQQNLLGLDRRKPFAGRGVFPPPADLVDVARSPFCPLRGDTFTSTGRPRVILIRRDREIRGWWMGRMLPGQLLQLSSGKGVAGEFSYRVTCNFVPQNASQPRGNFARRVVSYTLTNVAP